MKLPKALRDELIKRSRRQTGKRGRPPANPVLKIPKGPSVNEMTFRWLWQQFGKGAEGPVYEHPFAADRRWRFDAAWPERMLAVEIEGGSRMQGRHQRAKGFQADVAKYNRAVALGWRVLRFTDRDLQERPVQVIEEVLAALKSRNHG